MRIALDARKMTRTDSGIGSYTPHLARFSLAAALRQASRILAVYRGLV